MHILFYDPVCRAPYAGGAGNIPGIKIGGAETTLARVAERLGEKYRVSVGQHNRLHREKAGDGRVEWLTRDQALDPSLNADVVVLQRKVWDLPLVRRAHPGARLFVWNHDWFEPPPALLSSEGLRWRAKVEARVLLYTLHRAAAIAVSRTHMNNIRENLGHTIFRGLRGKIRLDFIYNPIDDELGAGSGGTRYDATKLVYFSAPWKGLDMVLDTFAEVHRELPDLKLYIANPGYQAMGAADRVDNVNVIYLGNLAQDAVLREVREALCVFYPADRVPETFGLVFAESNAVGTPVLAHPFGAAPELLTPEQLVDARDRRAVIERLRSWMNGRRPVVRAREELRLTNVVGEWERVLFS